MATTVTAEQIPRQAVQCAHCGDSCRDLDTAVGELSFCCSGCRAVWQILHENHLDAYYARESARPGIRPTAESGERFAYLDDPLVRERLVDYDDGRIVRLTLIIPQMHCSACVWLLENLHSLNSGVGRATVHFPRRELMLVLDSRKTTLRAVVELLASLGYEPVINLDSLGGPVTKPSRRGLYTRIGVAGFAFGNIMLLAFPGYLSSLPLAGTEYPWLFGMVSLGLALPVLLYSAQDFFVSAWMGLKQRTLNIDVPIALGFLALFVRSAYEVFSGIGPGYLDSFSGLVFFLLLGRLFQQKSYEALSFERDYKSYFPVSVIRKTTAGEESVPLPQLVIGDTIVIRNRELIPADGVLLDGESQIDYSFVTGESDLVNRRKGERIYAGGRQVGAAIDILVTKAIEQSYLTRLWNHVSFTKGRPSRIESLANGASRYFTFGVLTIALLTAGYWALVDPTRMTLAVVSVLIVACPCALALASPFVLGTALRILGRHEFYVKNTDTVERLAGIDAIVFDKTGTLTTTGHIHFEGVEGPLTSAESCLVASVARHSTHPLSRRLAELGGDQVFASVTSFEEVTGQGLIATIANSEVALGRKAWATIHCHQSVDSHDDDSLGSSVHFALDGKYRGRFVVTSVERTGLQEMLHQLARMYELSLVSGDTSRERSRFERLLGGNSVLRFDQSPDDKLDYVAKKQAKGIRVAMLGDGLNDAGALRQSDVGIAVAAEGSTFTPASDVIVSSAAIDKLPRFFSFARRSRLIIIFSFIISIIYNIVGLGFAASGHLTPLVSAILMPVSSVTVVLVATLGTRWQARREGLA